MLLCDYIVFWMRHNEMPPLDTSEKGILLQASAGLMSVRKSKKRWSPYMKDLRKKGRRL